MLQYVYFGLSCLVNKYECVFRVGILKLDLEMLGSSEDDTTSWYPHYFWVDYVLKAYFTELFNKGRREISLEFWRGKGEEDQL